MKYTDQINEYISDKLITLQKFPALYDYQFQLHLQEAPWKDWLSQSPYFDIYDEYITAHINWINSTKNNSIVGLNNFSKIDVISGTTQAFDEAYLRYKDQRLRVFSNEYGYHRRNVFFEPLNDYLGNYVPLEQNDWVIISLPFCGNGGVADHYDKLMQDAQNKNIPVLVDCAWFGTCKNINFDFNNAAIQEVTFSLSKGIGLGNMRTGIRFSNYDDGYIRQQNNFKHLIFSNMQIGLWQMEKFSPDFISNKYTQAYINMCSELNINDTLCIHVAKINDTLVGVRNLVKKYFRDEKNNSRTKL